MINFLLTFFNGICVVIGDIVNSLLNNIITGLGEFLYLDLSKIYSVMPGYLLCRKCFFEIGPLITMSLILLSRNLRAISKHLEIYFLNLNL